MHAPKFSAWLESFEWFGFGIWIILGGGLTLSAHTNTLVIGYGKF